MRSKQTYFHIVITLPRINFINVLRSAITRVDPESVRIQSNPQILFTLLGSSCAKAAPKTLLKSTPDLSEQNRRQENYGEGKRKRTDESIETLGQFH